MANGTTNLQELSRKYMLKQVKHFGMSSVNHKDVSRAVAKVSRALDEIRSVRLALKKTPGTAER
jgi:hypothetical protein